MTTIPKDTSHHPAPKVNDTTPLKTIHTRLPEGHDKGVVSRTHTANIHDGLAEVRRIVQSLALKRDQRRDAFAKAMQRAMVT